jgi:hypothetical protein
VLRQLSRALALGWDSDLGLLAGTVLDADPEEALSQITLPLKHKKSYCKNKELP